MNKKKIGFTLPEILMTLVLAGFIAIASVQAINANRTAYTSLAYYAFNNLKSAVGELIIPEIKGEKTEETLKAGEIMYTEMREGPFGFEERLFKTGNKPGNDYWELLEWGLYDTMNTQDFGASRKATKYTMQKANSNSLTLPAKPDLITTNGQKYYVGGHNTGTAYNHSTGKNGTYGYRIVAIDINGEAKPNSTKGVGSLPPDIITFAVLDSGEILPLGAAADNYVINGKTYNYLTSKINAFRFKKPDSDISNMPAFCDKTDSCDYDKEYIINTSNRKVGFSFRQAYCQARIAEDVVLDSYCDGIAKNTSCPPYPNGTAEDVQFDVCKQEVIKPMFRFNFN